MKLTVIVTCLGNIYIKFGISKIFDGFFFKSLMLIKAVFYSIKNTEEKK